MSQGLPYEDKTYSIDLKQVRNNRIRDPLYRPIDSLDKLKQFLGKNSYYETIFMLLDLYLISYEEKYNPHIEAILDYMIDEEYWKDMGMFINGHYALYFRYYLFVCIKGNVQFGFNKMLYIARKAYDIKQKDILYYILSWVLEYNINLLPEVMRAFPIRDIFQICYMSKDYVDESKQLKLKVKNLQLTIPLNVEYTIDDISVIYKRNNNDISIRQLSLITGLDIEMLINDPGYSIFFNKFSHIMLDMLEEGIKFDNKEYKLSDDKRSKLYKMEKEHYKTFMTEEKEHHNKNISYYIIDHKDLQEDNKEDKKQYDELKNTVEYELYDNYRSKIYYKDTTVSKEETIVKDKDVFNVMFKNIIKLQQERERRKL